MLSNLVTRSFSFVDVYISLCLFFNVLFAGNLLVRRGADGKPQLVILDHGMYRQLGQGFRASYCRIWQALIMQVYQIF